MRHADGPRAHPWRVAKSGCPARPHGNRPARSRTTAGHDDSNGFHGRRAPRTPVRRSGASAGQDARRSASPASGRRIGRFDDPRAVTRWCQWRGRRALGATQPEHPGRDQAIGSHLAALRAAHCAGRIVATGSADEYHVDRVGIVVVVGKLGMRVMVGVSSMRMGSVCMPRRLPVVPVTMMLARLARATVGVGSRRWRMEVRRRRNPQHRRVDADRRQHQHERHQQQTPEPAASLAAAAWIG